jgi:prepilin-type processing-associated H-X9-DG protein
VFASAREKARQTACLSNGKQIGLAFIQYTQDYDEITPNAMYPLSGNTNNAHTLGYLLDPFIKSTTVWRCPSDTLHVTPVDPRITSNYYGFAGTSYGYNYYLMMRSKIVDPTVIAAGTYIFNGVPVSISQLLTPAQDAVVVGNWGNLKDDNNAWAITSVNSFQAMEGFPLKTLTAPTEDAIRGHNNGGTIVYADGHAKWQPGMFLYGQYKIEAAAAGGAYRAFGVTSTLFHE